MKKKHPTDRRPATYGASFARKNQRSSVSALFQAAPASELSLDIESEKTEIEQSIARFLDLTIQILKTMQEIVIIFGDQDSKASDEQKSIQHCIKKIKTIDSVFIKKELYDNLAHKNPNESSRAFAKLSQLLLKWENVNIAYPEIDGQSHKSRLLDANILPKTAKESSAKHHDTNKTISVRDFVTQKDIEILFMLNSYYLPNMGGTSARKIYEKSVHLFIEYVTNEHDDFLQLKKKRHRIFMDKEAYEFHFLERFLPTISQITKHTIKLIDGVHALINHSWKAVKRLDDYYELSTSDQSSQLPRTFLKIGTGLAFIEKVQKNSNYDSYREKRKNRNGTSKIRSFFHFIDGVLECFVTESSVWRSEIFDLKRQHPQCDGALSTYNGILDIALEIINNLETHTNSLRELFERRDEQSFVVAIRKLGILSGEKLSKEHLSKSHRSGSKSGSQPGSERVSPREPTASEMINLLSRRRRKKSGTPNNSKSGSHLSPRRHVSPRPHCKE